MQTKERCWRVSEWWWWLTRSRAALGIKTERMSQRQPQVEMELRSSHLVHWMRQAVVAQSPESWLKSLSRQSNIILGGCYWLPSTGEQSTAHGLPSDRLITRRGRTSQFDIVENETIRVMIRIVRSFHGGDATWWCHGRLLLPTCWTSDDARARLRKNVQRISCTQGLSRSVSKRCGRRAGAATCISHWTYYADCPKHHHPTIPQ